MCVCEACVCVKHVCVCEACDCVCVCVCEAGDVCVCVMCVCVCEVCASCVLCVFAGTPVSQGVVGGPARVVLSLTDAHRIQVTTLLASCMCVCVRTRVCVCDSLHACVARMTVYSCL